MCKHNSLCIYNFKMLSNTGCHYQKLFLIHVLTAQSDPLTSTQKFRILKSLNISENKLDQLIKSLDIWLLFIQRQPRFNILNHGTNRQHWSDTRMRGLRRSKTVS